MTAFSDSITIATISSYVWLRLHFHVQHGSSEIIIASQFEVSHTEKALNANDEYKVTSTLRQRDNETRIDCGIIYT